MANSKTRCINSSAEIDFEFRSQTASNLLSLNQLGIDSTEADTDGAGIVPAHFVFRIFRPFSTVSTWNQCSASLGGADCQNVILSYLGYGHKKV